MPLARGVAVRWGRVTPHDRLCGARQLVSAVLKHGVSDRQCQHSPHAAAQLPAARAAGSRKLAATADGGFVVMLQWLGC
jgi:hypothetical protein